MATLGLNSAALSGLLPSAAPLAPAPKPIKAALTLDPEHVDHLLGMLGSASPAPALGNMKLAPPPAETMAPPSPLPVMAEPHHSFWRTLAQEVAQGAQAGLLAGNKEPLGKYIGPQANAALNESKARTAEENARVALDNAEAARAEHPAEWAALSGTSDLYNRTSGQVVPTGAEPLRPSGKYFTSPDNKQTVFVPAGENPPQGYLPSAAPRALNPQTATFDQLVQGGAKPLDALKEIESAMQSGHSSYSGPYAKVRLASDYLRYAMWADPTAIPAALHLLNGAAQSLGMNTPIPTNAPPPGTFATGENGVPLGTRAIANPTGKVREEAAIANRTMPTIADALQLLHDPEVQKNIGVVTGNWANWAKGKKAVDPKVAQLQADLGFIATAAPTIHANYQGTEEEFEKLLGMGQSLPDLQTNLGQIYTLFSHVIRQGTHGIPTGGAEQPNTPETRRIKLKNGSIVNAEVRNGKWINAATGQPIQ